MFPYIHTQIIIKGMGVGKSSQIVPGDQLWKESFKIFKLNIPNSIEKS